MQGWTATTWSECQLKKVNKKIKKKVGQGGGGGVEGRQAVVKSWDFLKVYG